uniref:Uncharacterized protein n=2 Tax=Phaeomonas parva TaxID=124430 RepID=A0A7S1UF62_9STRA
MQTASSELGASVMEHGRSGAAVGAVEIAPGWLRCRTAARRRCWHERDTTMALQGSAIDVARQFYQKMLEKALVPLSALAFLDALKEGGGASPTAAAARAVEKAAAAHEFARKASMCIVQLDV